MTQAGSSQTRTINTWDQTLHRSRYFGAEPVEQAVAGVYRIDGDGSLHLLTSTIAKPNGIALSPDEKILYVDDCDNGILDRARQGQAEVLSGRMQIVAFDLGSGGELNNRRVIVDYGEKGSPDGLAVDGAGRVWVANSSKDAPEIDVYDAGGYQLASLRSPEPPYNLLLVSRPDGAWLYVTAGRSLYRLRLERPAP